MNDIKLKILSGNYAAFKELYLMMYASLKSFANIYTHDQHMAEDVLADVFLKLWDRRDHLQNVQNLRVYLYTAVKNTAINYRNRHTRVIDIVEDISEFQSEASTPENILISAETADSIQKAIHALPPRCRLIFQLAKEEGMRYKEIASVLNISIKTIDSQLAIAIKKIGETILSQEKQKGNDIF